MGMMILRRFLMAHKGVWLAAKLRVSAATVHRWKTGKSTPSAANIRKLKKMGAW